MSDDLSWNVPLDGDVEHITAISTLESLLSHDPAANSPFSQFTRPDTYASLPSRTVVTTTTTSTMTVEYATATSSQGGADAMVKGANGVQFAVLIAGLEFMAVLRFL